MKRLPLITAALFAILFVIYFSWFDIVRHHKTNSTRFDLGNVEHVEWNLVHGRGFTETDPYGTSTVSRFAFHADPFLMVLAPFYMVFPRTETLLVLQVLAVGSGGLALFFIGRKILSPWWGTLFSFLYIVNPATHWATIFDIHAVTFATPLILWAVLAAMNKRYWWTLGLVMLAMMTKEEIGLGLMAIGIYVWWRQGQPTWGSILTFIPLFWSLAMLLVVVPHYRDLTAGGGEIYQTVFGTGAKDIIIGGLTHPVKFLHQLLAHQNLVMAAQLLAPLGFISLGSLWSFGAIPDYAINGLSLKPAQHLVISHYTSGLTPWLFVGAVMMTAWIVQHIQQRINLPHDQRTLVVALVVWLLGWSGYSAWAIGPLPGAQHDASSIVKWRNDYAAPIAKWGKIIPTQASVSVTNDVGAHFARRENFYSFPLGVDQSDYVVVLEHHATPVVASDEEVSAKIAQLRIDSAWTILERSGDLTVLKHR